MAASSGTSSRSITKTRLRRNPAAPNTSRAPEEKPAHLAIPPPDTTPTMKRVVAMLARTSKPDHKGEEGPLEKKAAKVAVKRVI